MTSPGALDLANHFIQGEDSALSSDIDVHNWDGAQNWDEPHSERVASWELAGVRAVDSHSFLLAFSSAISAMHVEEGVTPHTGCAMAPWLPSIVAALKCPWHKRT